MDNQKSNDKQNTSEEDQVRANVTGNKNATVVVGRDNKGNITISNYINIPSVASISLAAISLLADIVALGQLAYNIIVKGETSNIILPLVAIILVFLLGYGLGMLGLRGFAKTSVERVLQFYVWGYLILACLSYFGVISTFRSPYNFSSYIAYIIIIVIQLAAFWTLRNVCDVKPEVAHALALMTVSVIHALIFLYNIIYVAVPELIYLIGEWVFWFGWTMSAVPMIRIAFSRGGRAGKPLRSKLR